ncbi:transposase family protein [Streptomyces sp. NPDC006463]|uniref:transposase family protein n=1 Tax=Streptomyces sp. NPDC006463 TaxID=3364746 RepID=UPI0036799175
MRLRNLADVFASAEAEGIQLRIGGAETQVRRPRANRPGRRAFVSGKKKLNTIKSTTITDGQGRLLWSGADRPGRMHDQTAMRTEGIAEQFRLRPRDRAEVDEGYRGPADEFPDQVSAPPKKRTTLTRNPFLISLPPRPTASIETASIRTRSAYRDDHQPSALAATRLQVQ